MGLMAHPMDLPTIMTIPTTFILHGLWTHPVVEDVTPVLMCSGVMYLPPWELAPALALCLCVCYVHAVAYAVALASTLHETPRHHVELWTSSWIHGSHLVSELLG